MSPLSKPLTRDRVTVASRLMLPTHFALNLFWGINFVFDPFDRVQFNPSYTYPMSLTGGSMAPWGIPFFLLALLLAVALLSHQRRWAAYSLCMATVTWVLWAGVTTRSVFVDPMAQPTAPVIQVFVAIAALATTLSLFKGEQN